MPSSTRDLFAQVLVRIQECVIAICHSESKQAGLSNRRVRHFANRLEWRGMEWILRRIVADERVTTNHRPPRIIGEILVAAVKCIAVKEDRVTRFHLAVHELELVQNLGHPRE